VTAAWDFSKDPKWMAWHLSLTTKRRASLLCCAIIRRFWARIEMDGLVRDVVSMAENVADGADPDRDLLRYVRLAFGSVRYQHTGRRRLLEAVLNSQLEDVRPADRVRFVIEAAEDVFVRGRPDGEEIQAALCETIRGFVDDPNAPITFRVRSGDLLTMRGGKGDGPLSGYRMERAGPDDDVNAIALKDEDCGEVTVRPSGVSPGSRTVWPVWPVGPHPWITPLVLSLAEAAYRDRDRDGRLAMPNLLPVADALEEAGCVGPRVYYCGESGKHSHAGFVGEVIHGVYHAENPNRPHHHHDARCRFTYATHPALKMLRGRGPYYPGMEALDAILGRDR